MKTTHQHSMIFELTHPVSGWILNGFHAAQDLITRLQVERMRKQHLNARLELLTDPTFLDRATAGEIAE